MAGLYAGITFSADGSTSSSSGAAGPVGAPLLPSTSTTTASSSSDTADAQRQREAALRDAEAYAAQQADLAAKEAAENARKAALGFQPVVRKRAAPSKARPGATTAGAGAGHAQSAVSGATISAAPSLYGAPSGDASTSAVISAPPMELDSAASGTNKNAGRTLNAPPSMTLDDDNDDVNGFRATNAGKKAANKQSKAKKNKRKHISNNSKREQDPLLAWDAEYDPSRPTDYNEYKAHAKAARAERRAQMLRDRRKKAYQEAGKAGSGSGSDDYTDEDSEDSDDERRKRIAKANSRFFAPPTSYGEETLPPDANRMDEDDTGTDRRPIALEEEQESKEPVSDTAAQDSDWAAWSAAPAVVPDDPFARRMALSREHEQQQSIQAPQPPERQPSPLPPTSSYRTESLSYGHQGQGMSPPVPPPSFVGQGGQEIPLPPHMMPPSLTARSPLGSASPANAPSPYAAAAAAESTSASPATGGPIPAVLQDVQVQDARAKTIEEAQARAKAIAAKLAGLGKLGGGGPPQADAANRPSLNSSGSMNSHGMFAMPSADEPIPGLGGPPNQSPATSSAPKEEVRPEDFAKTLMAKYGWTKGQGLGATSQGMVNPLALADSTGGQKKKHHDQHQQNPSTKTGPVGIATSKGRIVSDLKTEKEQEERRKYGEPTRVVCLSNMVGRGEVDDELVSDVSEEARKLGIMENCFAHTLPPYVPDDEAVRVFITFSGLVGAWKAVKAFDGRFFGGRTVKAKFYEERALDIGALHL